MNVQLRKRKPRHYEPVWVILKRTNTARLIVPPGFVARVVKAVIKEKDMDVMFKFKNVDGDKFKLSHKYDSGSCELTFTLSPVFGLWDKEV